MEGTGNTSTDRQPMRAVAAAIVLATDLPMPPAIRFHVYPDGKGILSLNLDSVPAGQQWSHHLGGTTDTYINSDGLRYLNEGVIVWRGWRVQIHATDHGQPDAGLDADTAAALTAIAEVES